MTGQQSYDPLQELKDYTTKQKELQDTYNKAVQAGGDTYKAMLDAKGVEQVEAAVIVYAKAQEAENIAYRELTDLEHDWHQRNINPGPRHQPEGR